MYRNKQGVLVHCGEMLMKGVDSTHPVYGKYIQECYEMTMKYH
jgi:hypothetical protein